MDIDTTTRQLVDDGFLIEAGWQSLKALTLKGASDVQVREMRKAFFAGAQHLFSSIISFIEDGEDVTPNDLRRIEMIHVELEAYVDSLKREAKEEKDK